MFGMGDTSAQAPAEEPVVPQTGSETPIESAQPTETTAQPAAEEGVQASEEAGSDSEVSGKEAQVDAIFADLEPKVLSGDTDKMNALKNELLSAKIKIKRLLA